jgi:uncharacterized membrane protein (UPF0182 family)
MKPASVANAARVGFHYIRNSKATIDAYDGTMRFFVIDRRIP